MAFEIPQITYSGKIRETRLGQGEKAVTVGGENSYPFYLFEGQMPHLPKIAFEIYDSEPEEWPPSILKPFQDVIGNPAAWARKCLSEFKAEAICLRLASADPNGLNRPADEIIPIVKEVAEAIDVPLIVWGCENDEKDAEALTKIAEACQGKRLILGPATDKNYKKIGAAAIAYKHTVVASTPIDINLAKQLNILLGDLGVPDEQIIMDPNIGGCSLGYGIEYTYTVMERARQAALTQGDTKLQFPMVANFATDVWKKKETKTTEEEEPRLGNAEKRGILLEALTATTLLLAGADLLVMRHPESIRLVRRIIEQLQAKE
ncbi:MAG: acetyl-CoA decarbonylase/synthase complex subunit delta [Candidatus Omnitrophica bacterium]|nr:acetyl-CoA decarbonylase/synthase complex subunit delta [Candidatus Omnitrophota bacterium]